MNDARVCYSELKNYLDWRGVVLMRCKERRYFSIEFDRATEVVLSCIEMVLSSLSFRCQTTYVALKFRREYNT